MSDCYNRNHPAAIELENKYGRLTINLLYHMNDHVLPTPEQAERLMAGKGEKYSDIQLQEPSRYGVPAHITNFSDVYAAISDMKDVVEQEGGFVDKLSARGFTYRIPGLTAEQAHQRIFPDIQQNKYYQLTNKQEEKHDLQELLRGNGQQAKGDLIQTAANYYRRDAGNNQKEDVGGFWKGQSFDQYIKKKNLIWEGQLNQEDYIGRGDEQDVFHKKGADIVIKVNTGLAYANWGEYMTSLLLHNKTFPAVKYTFKGFIYRNDSWQAVVEQPYIDTPVKATNEQIKEVLGNIGYKPYIKGGSEDYIPTNYHNEELGTILNDMHPNNVLVKEGELFFIDTTFGITPDFWKQGNKNYQLDNVNKTIQNGIQSGITQAMAGRFPDRTFQTAFSLVRKAKGNGKGGTNGGQEIPQWGVYKEAGLEYKGKLGEQIAKGGEHVVLINKQDGKVIKIKHDIDNNYEMEVYLKDMIVHNILFPSTSYTLKGFVEYEGRVSPVVEQPAIERDSPYDPVAINNVLTNMGFAKVSDTEYRNDDISIGDLYPRNVHFRNGIPFFIDPAIVVSNRVYRDIERDSQQKVSSSEKPNRELNNKVKQFIQSVGGSVTHVPDTGQGYSETIDTLSAAIEIVDGKAGIETLGHAAIHQFVDLLPDGSKLLSDVIREGKKSEQYDDIYNQYKDDPDYKNSDGTVNEEKMAKEAFAHIADDILVGKFKNRAAKSLWEKLWQWIKDFIGRVREALGGKSLTLENLPASELVSEEILGVHTGRLSKEKLRAIKEANMRGEVYYQKSPEVIKRAEELKKGANEIQKVLIDAIMLDPVDASPESKQKMQDMGIKPNPSLELRQSDHKYYDPKIPVNDPSNIWKSTTTQIHGEFPAEKQKLYEHNKEAGNTCDKILEAVTNGGTYDEVMKLDTPMFESEDLKRDFIGVCREFIKEQTEDGSIAISQVITSDPVSKTAGSKDLSLIHPSGFERIVDLKTSVRNVYDRNGKLDKELSKTYTSMWEQNPGSMFNDLTFNSDDQIVPRTEGDKPIKLSKQLQHGIQVGAYAKMDEAQGIPVVDTSSWHINVDLQQKADGTYVIKSFRNEGIVEHSLEENQPYIDAVIPTPIDNNNPSKLQENRPGYDYTKEPEYDDPVEAEALRKQSQKLYNAELDNSAKAAGIAKEITKLLNQRIQYIESLNSSQQVPAIQQKTIIELNTMKHDFMRYLDKGKYSSILNKWMQYTIKQSATTATYLGDPTNLDSDKFTSIAAQARKFIQSYAYINELVDQVHGTQIAKFNEAVGAVNNLRQVMESSMKQWFEFHGKAADTKYLDQEIQDYINGNPEDINIFSRLFGAPSATSSIPVSLAFKEISDAVFKWNEAHEEYKTNAKQIESTLHKALGQKGYKDNMYEFMTHKNGRFVIRESPAQLQREADAWKALQDDNGEKKQWRTGGTDEDLAYNIQLQEDLTYYRELLAAENRVPAEYLDGQLFSPARIEPGKYYEYKPVPIYDEEGKVTGYDDFEEQRDKFEKEVNGKWAIQFSPDAVQDLRWTKVDGKYYEENLDGTKGRLLTDNERKGLAALEYRYKYYQPYEKSEYKPVYEKGIFTGKVVPRDENDKIGWRVKPQYKSMRDKSTDNQDLRDPKYTAMIADQTPQGRAKWQFYKDYMANWEKLYRKMPSDRVQQIKGKIPVQSGTLYRQIMDSDTPQTKLALLGDHFKDMFSSTYVGERMVDEAGNIKQSIPMGFSGALKDQEAIDKTKVTINKLDTEWKAIKGSATKQQVSEYKKQRDLLTAELKTAEDKIMPYQIEKDIVKSQIDTANKIEAYDQLSKIENNFLMIREMAAVKAQKGELAKTDANGRSLFKKVINELGTSIKKALTGGDGTSNELRRIDDMMKMLLYKSEEYPGSFWAKIEQLPITLSALNLFLINPPVSFGVHIMMNSIHLKEAAVGQFFNMKNYGKAKVQVNKAVLGYLQNTAIKAGGGDGKKFGSYPEAWVAKTQAFTKGLSDDAGGLRDILKMEHYVEWTGVATGAIAIAYHTPVKGTDGTISNMYDIFDQLPDGALQVKPNYEQEWNKRKFNFNRLMADYQNRFHGAYAPLERAAITQYPLGKSIMYLHKWIPASIWSMWAPRSVHSNLGVTEGQIITLGHFLRDLKDHEGSIMQKFQTGYRDMIPKGAVGNPDWNNMTKEQQDEVDEKAYQADPAFKKADGSYDKQKAGRDRDTRRLELANMKRNLVTVVYLMIATASYMLLKSLAEDTDSDNTRRWANFLAKSFDRLRKQQLFAIPVVGLQEEYSLLKSPIASLRTMGEFADAISATFSIPIPPYGANYYTTGVHKGELKAKVAWERILPGANLINWYQQQVNPNYWIK